MGPRGLRPMPWRAPANERRGRRISLVGLPRVHRVHAAPAPASSETVGGGARRGAHVSAGASGASIPRRARASAGLSPHGWRRAQIRRQLRRRLAARRARAPALSTRRQCARAPRPAGAGRAAFSRVGTRGLVTSTASSRVFACRTTTLRGSYGAGVPGPALDAISGHSSARIRARSVPSTSATTSKRARSASGWQQPADCPHGVREHPPPAATSWPLVDSISGASPCPVADRDTDFEPDEVTLRERRGRADEGSRQATPSSRGCAPPPPHAVEGGWRLRKIRPLLPRPRTTSSPRAAPVEHTASRACDGEEPSSQQTSRVQEAVNQHHQTPAGWRPAWQRKAARRRKRSDGKGYRPSRPPRRTFSP